MCCRSGYPWEIDSEGEGDLRVESLSGCYWDQPSRKGSKKGRLGQKEKRSCNAGPAKASADPKGSRDGPSGGLSWRQGPEH